MKTHFNFLLACSFLASVVLSGCGGTKETPGNKEANTNEKAVENGKTRISKRSSISKKVVATTRDQAFQKVGKAETYARQDDSNPDERSSQTLVPDQQVESEMETTVQIINRSSNVPFPEQLLTRPKKPDLIIKTKDDLAKQHAKMEENKFKYVEVEVIVGESVNYSEVSQYEWEFPIREELKIRRITFDGYLEKKYGASVSMEFQEGEPWKFLTHGGKATVRGYYMLSSDGLLLLSHCECIQGDKGVGELTRELMDSAKMDENFEMPMVTFKGEITGIRKDPESLIDQLAMLKIESGARIELCFSPRDMKLETGQKVEIISDYLTYDQEDDLFRERNPVRIDSFPKSYLRGK